MDINVPAILTSDQQPLLNIRRKGGWVSESILTLYGRDESLSVPASNFHRLVGIPTGLSRLPLRYVLRNCSVKSYTWSICLRTEYDVYFRYGNMASGTTNTTVY